MDDFDQFERSLAAALRSDADMSVAQFEPATIASAAVASTRRRTLRIAQRFSVRPTSNRWPIAAAVVIGVLIVGALLPRDGRASEPDTERGSQPQPSGHRGSKFDTHARQRRTRPAFPGPAGTWIATGSMGTARFGRTAVRLLDGRVLVVGGARR